MLGLPTNHLLCYGIVPRILIRLGIINHWLLHPPPPRPLVTTPSHPPPPRPCLDRWLAEQLLLAFLSRAQAWQALKQPEAAVADYTRFLGTSSGLEREPRRRATTTRPLLPHCSLVMSR